MWLWKSRSCPHSEIRGIYGDEIHYAGGCRLQCVDCGQFLRGPVALAEARKGEKALYE